MPGKPWWRRLLEALVLCAGGFALAGWVLAASARPLLHAALLEWLHQRGVEADVTLTTATPWRVDGSIRLGANEDPDLLIERFELDLRYRWPWANGGWIEPTELRLIEPSSRVRLVDGTLEWGPLRDLFDRPTAASSTPKTSPGPSIGRVSLEGATLRLETEQGALELRADATLEGGEPLVVSGILTPQRLRFADLEGALRRGSFELRRGSGVTRIDLDVDLDLATAESLEGQNVRTKTTAWVRPTDDETHIIVESRAVADQLRRAETSAEDVRLHLGWSGAFVPGAGLVPKGHAGLSTTMRHLTVGTAHLRDVAAEVALPNLSRPRAHDSTFGSALVVGSAGELVQGRVRLSDVDVQGTSRLDPATPRRWTFEGTFAARRGSWTPREAAPRGTDVERIERALSDFAARSSDVRVEVDGDGIAVDLDSPLQVKPASGGHLTISHHAGQAFYERTWETTANVGTGAFELETRGGLFPPARFVVPRYVLAHEGERWRFEGETRGRAVLDLGALRGVAFRGAGRLHMTPETTEFSIQRCLEARARRIGEGRGELTEVEGSICPQGPSLFVRDGRNWQFEGRLADVRGNNAPLSLRFEDGDARLRARGGPGPIEVDLQVVRAHLLDDERRVRPLEGIGSLQLANQKWRGDFQLFKESRRVARVDLRHDVEADVGAIRIDARGLDFHPQGLQPPDLFPRAGSLTRSSVTGVVDLEANFDWNGSNRTSTARVRTEDLDFLSPAGMLHGLKTELRFTHLDPLWSAPRQSITFERLEGPVDVHDGRLSLTAMGDVLRLEDARFSAWGGRLWLAPIAFEMGASSTWEGTVFFRDVDLAALLRQTSLSERLKLHGVVGGNLRFRRGPQGFRLGEGRFASARGRISVDPTLVCDRSEANSSGGVSGFACQALQSLAYDQLRGAVTPASDGRLGVRLSIDGRHDPPRNTEARLRWRDVAARRFDRIDLPSGTEIDLTLDTAWNVDELVQGLVGALAQPASDASSTGTSTRTSSG